MSGSSRQLTLKKGAPGDQVRDLLCVQLASYLERGPLMWMMPLHLHVNQKFDYDYMNFVLSIFEWPFNTGFTVSRVPCVFWDFLLYLNHSQMNRNISFYVLSSFSFPSFLSSPEKQLPNEPHHVYSKFLNSDQLYKIIIFT